jgi:GNAT superfamily N-acetyltransferase
MIVFRPIRADEGQKLREIRLRALAESPSAFGSTLAETEARPEAYWRERAERDATATESVLVVADDDSGWVGLAGGCIDNCSGVRRAELISMWVDPAYRGRSLGRYLVEHIVAWARHRNAERVTLWVTQGNTPAISLYTRCGFRATGVTQRLPSNPALLEQQMVLDL